MGAYERLGLHALLYRKTPGQVLTDLINEHLREFHVHSARRARLDSALEADPADEVDPTPIESAA
jgi:hypothetical protein